MTTTPTTTDDQVTARQILDALAEVTDLPAFVEQTGGGVATITVYEGVNPDGSPRPTSEENSWGRGLLAIGPGTYHWNNPDASTFYVGDQALAVGPDDLGEVTPAFPNNLDEVRAAARQFLPAVAEPTGGGMLEARCVKCGESFNPHGGPEAEGGDYLGFLGGDHWYRHFVRQDAEREGDECGGEGVLVGSWS